MGEAGTPVDEESDRRLFDLLDEANVLREREDIACDAEEVAYDRIDRPKVLDILLRRDGEELLFNLRTPEGTPYCHQDIDAMKQHFGPPFLLRAL